MATAGEYFLSVVNGAVIVVTVVGGLLTIVAIWIRPNLRKLVNVPLVSLSCTDILFSTFYSPFWIQQLLNPLWEPPPALCWLIGYASPVLWGASLWHMLCIALQRYFTICTNSTRLKSKQALTVMLLLTWFLPILSFLPIFVMEEVKVDPKLKCCAMGNSDKLWAKVPPVILNCIFPYVAALGFYILIQNHVRKSKNRVHAHAQGPTNRLAVQFSRRAGEVAIPSTSAGLVKPARNLEGVAWVGDENSSASEDEQKASDRIEPGKPKVTIVQVAPASTTGKEQDKKPSSHIEECNECNEQDKPKSTTLTATIVSDQAGKTKRQAHVAPNNSSQKSNSAAERQITKMMMSLFVVYTLCNMPMTVMVIFSSKVPAEAFTVAQFLASLNGALNPIIYGVMNKNIRQGYRHIWSRMLNFVTCRAD